MKIRAVRLAEVGTFASPVAIENFSGGLDVLIGPNEQGKSTIFRAIDFVFQKRHTTTGKAVAALASRSGGAPLIEADFEAEGRLWRISKRFGRTNSAELTDLTANTRTTRGADAEETLARLIGLTGPSGAGRFGLLWVAQQASLTPPQPDESTERPTLRAAIRQEIDVVAGGELSRRVAARVSAELANYITSTKREPKKGSRYDLALQRRRKTIEEREACRRAVEQADERVQRLAELRAAHDSLHSPEAMAALQQAFSDCQRLAEQAEKAQGERERLEGLERAAEAAREQAGKRHTAFVDAQQEALRLDAERATIVAAAAPLEGRIAATGQRVAFLEGEIAAHERQHTQLMAEADRWRERRQLEQELDRLQAVRGKAGTYAGEVSRLEGELAGILVTPDRMRRLEDAERVARQAEIDAMRPAAVGLDIVLEVAGEGLVRIDGVLAKRQETRAVDGTVVIEIAGIGQFRIVPSDAAEREAARQAAQQAARARDGALAELGVKSLDEARELAAHRNGLAEALLGAGAQVVALVPAGMAALEAQIACTEQALAAVPVGEGGTDAASGEQLPQRLAGFASLVRELRAERETALLEHKELQHERQRCADRLSEISKRITQLLAVLGPPAEWVDAARRLAELADGACQEHDRLTRERMLFVETAPASGAVRQRVEAREAAGQRLQHAQQVERRLAEEIAQLEGFVSAAGEAERSLDLARLDGEIAELDREISHHEHEIEALKLLAATLADIEGENRARFLEPVTERLRPYLEQVFPDARVVFDEAFVPQRLARGLSSEALATLSDGTREQLAILVRLGFGHLLAEAGMAAPLILDDALVYSDDERIMRMFAALQAASAHHQVIVFSCRSRSFDRLGGTRLAITPWQSSKWPPA